MEATIRIILADDHPIVRQGLRRMFEADQALTIVAEAGDTAQSRKAYQDFFALWKDADAELPILSAARKEYEQAQ